MGGYRRWGTMGNEDHEKWGTTGDGGPWEMKAIVSGGTTWSGGP